MARSLRWTVAVALLAMAAIACDGGGCGGDDEPGATMSPAVAAAIEGLDAVPGAATAVIGIDVEALAKSELATRAARQLLVRDATLGARVDALVKGCKLDPARDLERILIALVPGGAGSPPESLLIVRGRFDESAIVACLGRFLGERGGRLESSRIAGRSVFEVVEPGGEGVWLAFGSERSAVVASSEAAMATALGDGPKLSESKRMRQLVWRADADAAVWAAGEVDPEVGQGLAEGTGGQVGAPSALYGHLGLEDGLDLFLGAEMPSADDAKKLVSLAKQQLEAAALVAQRHGLGPIVRRIEVSASEAVVRFHLRLGEAELGELLSAIDIAAGSVENPGPESGPQGDLEDVERDAPSGDEAPPR